MVVEIKRPSGRKHNEKRAVSVEIGTSKYAEGSCLIRFGDTHVFCTASVEEREAQVRAGLPLSLACFQGLPTLEQIERRRGGSKVDEHLRYSD